MSDLPVSQPLALVILGAFALVTALAIGVTAWVIVHQRRVWRFATRGIELVAESRPGSWLRERYPRAWSFIGRRLAPGEYLGLHLTAGLLLSVAAVAAFVAVVENVLEPSDLAAVDRVVPQILHHALGTGAAEWFLMVTHLGSGIVLTAIVAIGVVTLLLQKRWALAAVLVIAGAGGGVLNRLLKAVFQRERPEALPGVEVPLSWSFPSGHAMGSLVVYGLLSYAVVISVRSSAVRIGIIAAAAVLIVLIGVSRIFLGVHYFSDVIGGYAAGTVWLAVVVSGSEVLRRRRRTARGTESQA